MTRPAPAVIAVASDQALVAEALAAALSAHGLAVTRIPWGADVRQVLRRDSGPAAVGVLVSDLRPEAIEPARHLVRAYPSRWLLLTEAPPGLAWGALLDAGIVGIRTSTITLGELLVLVGEFAAGRIDEIGDRAALVDAWREAHERHREVHRRLSRLTDREFDVLRLLGTGRTVPEIAALHDVALSTVRSQVRAVLRKLDVHTQLAAVAVLVRAESDLRSGSGPFPPRTQDWG